MLHVHQVLKQQLLLRTKEKFHQVISICVAHVHGPLSTILISLSSFKEVYIICIEIQLGHKTI